MANPAFAADSLTHQATNGAAENVIGEQATRPAPSAEEGQQERLTIDDAAALMSPARQLQDTLGREFAAVEEMEPWPLRRTVALVTMTCGAFWTAVYFAIAALAG